MTVGARDNIQNSGLPDSQRPFYRTHFWEEESGHGENS